jgi:hypothetical protein
MEEEMALEHDCVNGIVLLVLLNAIWSETCGWSGRPGGGGTWLLPIDCLSAGGRDFKVW